MLLSIYFLYYFQMGGSIMQLPDIFHFNNALSLQSQASELLQTNKESARYGLVLTSAGALALISERNQVLKNVGRIELESSLTQKIIHHFCDSAFIQQDDYVATLIELQEVFYEMKNETEDSISDDELLIFLKDFYEKKCDGDLEYLKGKYLDELVRTTRRQNQINDFHLDGGDQ